MKNEKQKILLVNAPAENYKPSGNVSLFPSLGVITLATHIKKDYPNLDIRVIDGGIFATSQIIKKIDEYKPTIIGLSVLTSTYKQGLEIGEYAKKKYNSIIILGNDHASFFSELILKNRPFVDFVIKTEMGEILLPHLIGYLIGEKNNLPNSQGDDGIFYREGNKIKRTYNPKPIFNSIYKKEKDIPNLDFIKDYHNIYIENYNERYKKFHSKKMIPMTMNIARGCKNYLKRCLYCSICDLEPKWLSSEFFWKLVKKYHNKYNVNLFYEVADEFLTFPRLIKEIIKTKPFNLKEKGIEMMVYARSDDVLGIPETIEWFKELNITRVNLGLDSGDNEMLKLLRKNLRVNNLSPLEINYQAVRLLAENNITIHASFPLGSIGETKESLNNTVEFIKRIINEFSNHISVIETSELVPMPNSMAGDILLGKENSKYYENLDVELKKGGINIKKSEQKVIREKYQNKDIIDIEEISRDWIKYFTHISWGDIEETKKVILNISKKSGIIYGRAI
jgi:radical SAM superfamily enzyme YgiQ (UPF0313 family)